MDPDVLDGLGLTVPVRDLDIEDLGRVVHGHVDTGLLGPGEGDEGVGAVLVLDVVTGAIEILC